MPLPPKAVRRALLPVQAALLLSAVLIAAATALVGLVTVIVDRRARLARIACMVGCYACLELVTLVLLFGAWLLRPLAGRQRAIRTDMSVTAWALGALLGAGRVLLGFRMEIEEPARLAPFDQGPPVLVLARHGGIGDSFAVAHLLIARYGCRLRVVLKQLLAWDPMLDVALTRMGAYWVPPSSGPARREKMQALAAATRPGEAILLFPEGGNWTPRRRISAMARLWRTGQRDAFKAAALMDHVLPPQPGGVFACLAARPDIRVVVMAHTGLDKITSFGDLWRALPFRSVMRLRWWPAAPPPRNEEERMKWLTAEWAVVDEWIAGSAATES